MTIQTRILSALIAAAGFQAFAEDAAPPAGAPPHGQRPPMGDFFAKKDADKDGKLNLAEFKTDMPAERAAKADEFFKKLDANSDGSVDKDEMKAGRPPHGRGPGGEGRGGVRRGPPPGGDAPEGKGDKGL